MRIALVAGTDAAGTDEIGTDVAGTGVPEADERLGMAAALREAGQQVSEHVLDARADVRTVMPDFVRSLSSLWSRERPDVVHALGWAGGLAALAAARDASLPVVTTLGSLSVTRRRPGSGEVQLERTRLERAIGSASRAVIAGSSEEADDLIRMGVSRRRVHMIPAAVDTSVYTPNGSVSPDARGADKAKPRVVVAAGIDDDQAVTVTRAVSLVPGAELIACPAGARGTELAAVLRSADVFVHVPVHAPRGTEILRAMACGVPVIASAVGAHTDMMVDGTTGLLVPPDRPQLLAARIRHLIGHPMLRQACGVAATDRAQSRHSRGQVTAETLAVYEASRG
jgi:glycosyltransferase involved in cell wall biosynthesis